MGRRSASRSRGRQLIRPHTSLAVLFLHSAYSTYEHSSISKSVGLSHPKLPLDVSMRVEWPKPASKARLTLESAHAFLSTPTDHHRNAPLARLPHLWPPQIRTAPQGNHLGRRDAQAQHRRGGRAYQLCRLQPSRAVRVWQGVGVGARPSSRRRAHQRVKGRGPTAGEEVVACIQGGREVLGRQAVTQADRTSEVAGSNKSWYECAT